MKRRSLRFRSAVLSVALFLSAIPAFSAASAGTSRWRADLESGGVFSGYNDIAIPGDTGTRFSLSKDFTPKAGVYIRARLTWRIAPRHSLSILYAPLKLTASGAAKSPVSFFGSNFAAGSEVTGTYVFNSYRLTYRYELVDNDKWRFGFGFTAKVRDAVIELAAEGRSARKTNVGFVPLLNVRAEYALSPKLTLLLDADALAAPQGRAEDVFLGAVYRVSPRIALKAGYRFVEGGAENAEVYTFALIHYAAVGILIDL
jgi:hypothetical protein